MEIYMKLLLVLFLALISSIIAVDIPSKSHELGVAIDEMTTANYFTFVTLINMSPLDHRIQGNVTFLMPNDRILSRTRISLDSVSDFLLRHSIPSPLLFDHLQHVPTGSRIPSSEPDYMLDINNNGRRSFFLNNVKIISPNICTAGSSIRCHGIDGVLADVQSNNTLPTCSNTTSPAVVVSTPPPAPSIPLAAAPGGDSNQTPVAAAPQPTAAQNDGQKKSGSSVSHERSLKFLLTFTFIVISIIWFNI